MPRSDDNKLVKLHDPVRDFRDYPYISMAVQRVLVLGSGDTAMDCVRTAVRQGAASVHCVYRRDRGNMPGSQREVDHATKEGVQFAFNTAPLALQHQGQTLQGLRVVRTRLAPDEAGGRARPELIEGSEEVLSGDVVIFAFGYRPSQAAQSMLEYLQMQQPQLKRA